MTTIPKTVRTQETMGEASVFRMEKVLCVLLLGLLAGLALSFLPGFLASTYKDGNFSLTGMTGWLENTPYHRFAFLGAAGAVVTAFFSRAFRKRVEMGTNKDIAWSAGSRASVGCWAGVLSFPLLQVLGKIVDAQVQVNTVPVFAYIFAFTAGFAGLPFFSVIRKVAMDQVGNGAR